MTEPSGEGAVGDPPPLLWSNSRRKQEGMAQAYFEASNVSKTFGATRALNDVTVRLYRKEIVGIVGENGAGKSSLLNILSGIYPPDTGELYLEGKDIRLTSYRDALLHGISRVFQETALVPNMHVYENFFLSFEHLFSRFGVLNRRRMIEECVHGLRDLGLAIDPERVTDQYDYPTRQMIEIAKAFSLLRFIGCDNPVVLLDEPTAALSETQVQMLFEKMHLMAESGTVVFVSHRLSEILKVSNRIYVLKDGILISEENPSEADEAKLHSLMVGRQRDRKYYKEDQQNFQFGSAVLEAANLSKDNTFRDVSFTLRECEILGVGGVAGSGKEDLGKTLAGWTKPNEGILKIRGNEISDFSTENVTSLGVGYIPKERRRDGIIPGLSVSWNITLPSIHDLLRTNLMLVDRSKERELTARLINDLDIRTPSVSTLCSSLSGGNQQKVSISKWLGRPLSVLVLDNPTMGIDVGTKEQLYRKFREIVKQGLPIILISDDLLELIGLSNRILIMKDGRVVNEIEILPEKRPTETEVISYMV